MRWLLAFLFLASVEAARLGGEQCRRDPTLWCDSLQTAYSCHALSHCLKHVWEVQKLQVKQTRECQYSQKVVKMVQHEFTKKADQRTGQTSYLVASMCTVIRDDSLRKQCKDMVTDFLPQILKLMDSAVEPATVAAMMGLCQPQEKSMEKVMSDVTDVDQETVGGIEECELCELVVSLVDQYLSQNKTEEEIQHLLDDVCQQLPSAIKPQCLSFIDEYAAMVVQMLVKDELEPHQVCLALTLCSSSSAAKKFTMQTSSAPGIFCTVCEVLVGMLEVQIAKNATEVDVEKALHVVCSLLPANLSMQCDALVKMYVPVIIDLLEREMPPAEICQKIGLCNATVSAALPKAAPVDRDSADSVKCELCKIIIAEINDLLGNNRSQQAIIHAVEKVCDVVTGDLRLECQNEVQNYGPAVLDLLQHMDDPTQVCTSLNLCASSTPSADSPARNGTGAHGRQLPEALSHH